VLNLYEYRVPEKLFRQYSSSLITDLATPDVEGIYETQVPLDFRAMVDLGCLCVVDKNHARDLASAGGDANSDTFELGWLQFKPLANYHYLPDKSFKTVYFYQHRVATKSLFGLFVPSSKKAHVFVVDTVRSNQMPNLNNMYNSERTTFLSKDSAGSSSETVPEADYSFEVRVETELKQVFKQIQKFLTSYKDEKRGATILVTQSLMDGQVRRTRFVLPVGTNVKPLPFVLDSYLQHAGYGGLPHGGRPRVRQRVLVQRPRLAASRSQVHDQALPQVRLVSSGKPFISVRHLTRSLFVRLL